MKAESATFARHQGTFFSHRLTLEGLGEDALAQSLLTKRGFYQACENLKPAQAFCLVMNYVAALKATVNQPPL